MDTRVASEERFPKTNADLHYAFNKQLASSYYSSTGLCFQQAHSALKASWGSLEGIGRIHHMCDPEIYIGRRDVPHSFFDEPLEKTDSTFKRHIKIQYNFATGRYELTVLQQINVYLEGHLVALGMTVPLNKVGVII